MRDTEKIIDSIHCFHRPLGNSAVCRIAFNVLMFLSLTIPFVINNTAYAQSNAFKYRFALQLDAAYTSGNTAQEGYTDWEGGFRQALRYLESKIGEPYDDDHVFYGFEIYLYSAVAILDAGESESIGAENATGNNASGDSSTFGNPDRYRTSEAECGIAHESETCRYLTGSVGLLGGPDVRKLYPDQPWLIAGELERTYAVPGSDPPNERLEQYDLVVTAYVGPPFVRFEIRDVDYSIHIDRYFTHPVHQVTTKELRESDFQGVNAFPESFTNTRSLSHESSSSLLSLNLSYRPSAAEVQLQSTGSVEKRDGRTRYLDSWIPHPGFNLYSNISAGVLLTITNPFKKEAVVRVAHAGQCTDPPERKGPWVQRTLFMMAIPLSEEEIPSDETDLIKPIYEDYGEGGHSGEKRFTFTQPLIKLVFMWEPHHMRATEFYSNQLHYGFECESSVKISVDGVP